LRIDEKYPEEVKGLLALAREKGCLTRSEIRLQLPEELLADPAEMDELHDLLRAQDIDILEGDQEFDAEDILGETLPPQIDHRRKNEPLPVAEQERTNDPVRMYLREMGTVPLLTREGEVTIAKRIEEGELKVLRALSQSRFGLDEILSIPERLKAHPKAVEEMFEISEDALGAKGGTLSREELIKRKVNQANKRVAKIRRFSADRDALVHRQGKLKEGSKTRRDLADRKSVV
jgi:RNA polymerase primary sigma factor